MKFISCISLGFPEKDHNDGEMVLCQCEIRNEGLLNSKDDIGAICIDELVVSEGNEIHRRQNLKISDLNIYEDSRQDIWYEFLKLLTGHKVQFSEMNSRINFSTWTCHTPSDSQWQLVMELESAGIVKKLAEINLDVVENGEVDMFQFTNILFHQWCESNDQLLLCGNQNIQNLEMIKSLKDERERLDEVLLRRDERTRIVVAEMLNEKKQKIRELSKEIELLQYSQSHEKAKNVMDFELLNSHVNQPVASLTSPGKRRKRVTGIPLERPAKKLILSREDSAESKTDDFDDFQFFGITKPSKDTAKLIKSAGNSPIKKIKQESQESTSVTTESDDPGEFGAHERISFHDLQGDPHEGESHDVPLTSIKKENSSSEKDQTPLPEQRSASEKYGTSDAESAADSEAETELETD